MASNMGMQSSPTAGYASFSITQPFLGAPLQFIPPLGSQELDDLIDAYVLGTAPKQDKLSQVTIDFYTHATVDLNTGALHRTYDVFVPSWPSHVFEQSTPNSQSRSFRLPIFTSSPESSVNLGDSGYGSVSLTPPIRSQRARISKRAKKETKKAAEVRLPGFSIMTKDGVDVTNSAGRGMKSREQREHAHLMRIIKACDDCKRKKVRCDPSHRNGQSDISIASSSNKASSPRDPDPSPAASTNTSLDSQFSFETSTPIGDFVLFPESKWNTTELESHEFFDLGQFNFDGDDIDLNELSTATGDQWFDFTSYAQSSTFQVDPQLVYSPLIHIQAGLDKPEIRYGEDVTGESPLRSHPPHSPEGGIDSSNLLWGSYKAPGEDAPSYLSTRRKDEHDYNRCISADQSQHIQDSTVITSGSSSPTLDWCLLGSSRRIASESSLDPESPSHWLQQPDQVAAQKTASVRFTGLLPEERFSSSIQAASVRLSRQGHTDKAIKGVTQVQQGEFPLAVNSPDEDDPQGFRRQRFVSTHGTSKSRPVVESSDDKDLDELLVESRPYRGGNIVQSRTTTSSCNLQYPETPISRGQDISRPGSATAMSSEILNFVALALLIMLFPIDALPPLLSTFSVFAWAICMMTPPVIAPQFSKNVDFGLPFMSIERATWSSLQRMLVLPTHLGRQPHYNGSYRCQHVL